jgi:hypothetical protein
MDDVRSMPCFRRIEVECTAESCAADPAGIRRDRASRWILLYLDLHGAYINQA